jgi:hypothetical protein
MQWMMGQSLIASGRVPKMKRTRLDRGARLFVAVGDPALGQIIRRHLDGDAIPGQDAYPVSAQFPGKMSEHETLGIELNAKLAGGEFLNYSSGHFNTIFFTH